MSESECACVHVCMPCVHVCMWQERRAVPMSMEEPAFQEALAALEAAGEMEGRSPADAAGQRLRTHARTHARTLHCTHTHTRTHTHAHSSLLYSSLLYSTCAGLNRLDDCKEGAMHSDFPTFPADLARKPATAFLVLEKGNHVRHTTHTYTHTHTHTHTHVHTTRKHHTHHTTHTTPHTPHHAHHTKHTTTPHTHTPHTRSSILDALGTAHCAW